MTAVGLVGSPATGLFYNKCRFDYTNTPSTVFCIFLVAVLLLMI